ncbi:MAG: DUF2249 domain-containing protein [Aquabacterium sp.]|nr:DUF2249 domain-containing protein [Aquabacterium sp.]
MALGEPGTQWLEGNELHLELRGLSPPAPLVLVLRNLGSVPAGGALVAHFGRDPMMLYPELAQRGWAAQRMDGPPDEVRLCLTPVA